MRILVSGGNTTFSRLIGCYPDILGRLLTPRGRHRLESQLLPGMPWAADNSAFSDFQPDAFKRFLNKIAGAPGCLFVAVPDVVGNARLTLEQFPAWLSLVNACGQPAALVGQDGAENLLLPWGSFQALFIGGSTRWKLSQASADLCQEAKRRGKWVHMGRVNSLRRLTVAYCRGCDSVDGTKVSRFGNTCLDRYCRHIRYLKREPHLFAN